MDRPYHAIQIGNAVMPAKAQQIARRQKHGRQQRAHGRRGAGMGWWQPEMQREKCRLEQQARAHQPERSPDYRRCFDPLCQGRDIHAAEAMIKQRDAKQVRKRPQQCGKQIAHSPGQCVSPPG